MRVQAVAPDIEYPETDGKPMGETDVHIRQITDLRHALQSYFHDDPQVYVSGNILLYYVEGDPTKVVSPDVFVVKGVPPGDRRIYKLWEEGKAPDVVFEITSKSTRLEDQGTKRALYTELGVAEYFLFDPLGEYLKPRLRGYRLAGDEYVPLMPQSGPGNELRLLSQVLGLELRTQRNELRLYDVAAARLLLTPLEEALARQEAEARAAAAEAELARLRAEIERLRRGK
jgi:Uma2 family endonuclease